MHCTYTSPAYCECIVQTIYCWCPFWIKKISLFVSHSKCDGSLSYLPHVKTRKTFFSLIASIIITHDGCVLRLKHCERAAELQAVETLLVTDELFRSVSTVLRYLCVHACTRQLCEWVYYTHTFTCVHKWLNSHLCFLAEAFSFLIKTML